MLILKEIDKIWLKVEKFKMENNSNFWKNRKIFPSITTITNSNWKKKVKEVQNLGLKEVCLFPTCLDEKERKELYQLLKKTKIEKVPLVHIKGDMVVEELDYLVKNYKVEALNIHSKHKHPIFHNYEKYKNIIYIEPLFSLLDEEEIKNYAGICLDFSHLENNRLLHPEVYENNIEIIGKYSCGCNHISPIKKFSSEEENKIKYDSHDLEDLSEFDYLKRYPASYFSSILAIEIENSIEEQLKVKDYIINLLRDKKEILTK